MKWDDVKKEIINLTEEEKMYIELLADIVSIRDEKGLTQRELAEITGLKQPAIARIESQQGVASVMSMLKILNALGYELKISPKE